MTHTATPWEIEKYGAVQSNGRQVAANGFEIICSAGGAQDESKANAAFIVRACNAHDDLVRALDDLICAINNKNPDAVDHVAYAEARARAVLCAL